MIMDDLQARVEVPRQGLASTPHPRDKKLVKRKMCLGRRLLGREDTSQLKWLKWKGLLK